MKKKAQVKFTKRANNDFVKMHNNIAQRSPRAANKFLDDFDDVKSLLEQNPDMFEQSKKDVGLRRGLFHKHAAFLYRVFKKTVRITTFFDTRQNR
jgi:plasmid stabilization system protein ParE